MNSDWLGLERALHRRQKAAIAQALGPRPRANLAYETRYRKRVQHLARRADPSRRLTSAALRRAISAVDVLFVGDYLTLPASQRAFAWLVEEAARDGRPAVIALQAFPVDQQRLLERFLEGRVTERTLRRRCGLESSDDEVRWLHLRPLLALAQRARLEILALDEPARSLVGWDAKAAARIAARAKAADRPRISVLAGEFHVTPAHLPEALRAKAPTLSSLSVYQCCEPVYWALARRGGVARTRAVRLADAELWLPSASPVDAARSFLDLLEGEDGDWLLEGDPAEAFGELARRITRALGLPSTSQRARPEITTRIEPALAAARRARLTEVEREQLARHILSRESGYFPGAELIYLATRSAHHAAEEATHWIRHLTVGPALLARRSHEEAFYARCLEEAFGFFGSRLVNPHRPVRSLEEWALAFHLDGKDRAAAFVLAHKTAEVETHAPPLPRGDTPLFHEVTHGLGYLLGDALHDAHARGVLGQRTLRALFRDPLEDPRATYFRLAQSVQA